LPFNQTPCLGATSTIRLEKLKRLTELTWTGSVALPETVPNIPYLFRSMTEDQHDYWHFSKVRRKVAVLPVEQTQGEMEGSFYAASRNPTGSKSAREKTAVTAPENLKPLIPSEDQLATKGIVFDDEE
jgi:hypothetical protein